MGKKRIVTQTGTEIDQADSTAKVKAAKDQKSYVGKATAYICSSYNNTLISLADNRGQILAWSSAGRLGFKGSRKPTPFAAALVAKDVLERVQKYNLTDLVVIVRGIGPGRDAAIRSLASSGLNIVSIVDDTPLPHNGVRPPKPRRV